MVTQTSQLNLISTNVANAANNVKSNSKGGNVVNSDPDDFSRNIEDATMNLTKSFQSFVNDKNSSMNTYSSTQMDSYKNLDSASSTDSSSLSTEYTGKDAYDQVSQSTYSKNVDAVKDDQSVSGTSTNDDKNVMTKDDASQVSDEIRSAIKEETGLSDEEIDAALASMDVSIFDLLQPEVMQDFLQQVTGTEPIDFLTNADLIQTFQNLTTDMTEIVSDITGESGVDLTELVQELEVADQTEIPTELMENLTDLSVETESAEDVVKDVNTNEKSYAKTSEKSDSQDETSKTSVSEKDESTGVTVTVEGTKEAASQNTDSESHTNNQNQPFANNIVNQLTEAVSEVEEVQTSYLSESEQLDIVQQVVDQIKVWNTSESSNMHVQLYPEHLGRVEIQVMLKNGAMTAQIITENEAAKAAIESQLQMLKESFDQKSIQVDAVEVSVATKDFSHSDENSQSEDAGKQTNSRKNSNGNIGYGFDEDEEEDNSELLRAQGSSVEYHA